MCRNDAMMTQDTTAATHREGESGCTVPVGVRRIDGTGVQRDSGLTLDETDDHGRS
jgi:hypothetical protein